jgi:hypothetical protein
VSRPSYPKPQSSHWNTVPTFRSSSFTIPQTSRENPRGAEIRIACNSWSILLCLSGSFKFDCFSAKRYENRTGAILVDLHCVGYRSSTIRSYKPIATVTTLKGWNKANDSQKQQPLRYTCEDRWIGSRNTQAFDSNLHVNKIYM